MTMPPALFLSPPLSNTHHFCNNSISSSDSIISILFFTTRFPNPLKTRNLTFSSKSLRVLPSETRTLSIENRDNNIQPQNTKFSFLTELSRPDVSIKMPTAPWMKGPLLLPANEVLDLSKIEKRKSAVKDDHDQTFTDKIRGGRGKQAMRKIVQSITKLRNISDSEKFRKEAEEFEFRIPLERIGEDGDSKLGERMPWAKAERIVVRRMKKEKVVTKAELTLPETLLTRLRSDAEKMKTWVKVKKAGVTQAVVDEVKAIWKKSELAMIKFDKPLCLNMDRAREIVETKSGGLVVWSKKDTLFVYRGCNFQSSPKLSQKLDSGLLGSDEEKSPWECEDATNLSLLNSTEITFDANIGNGEENSLSAGGSLYEHMALQSIEGTLYEREADRLLDGLGPRFIDWWRPKPLPVDADLLPDVVPNFKTPFRRSPPNVRPKLTDDELTYLRKLARPLPTHFALGRNTKLQGLAAAIIKLWEKSLIAKIAVKWGIPNTNNDQMAWELKRLTGGVLILRNKFYILLYRGKDFLPCGVANLITHRETELEKCQLQEEVSRLEAIESFHHTDQTVTNTSTVGTFSEFQDIQTKCGPLNNESEEIKVQMEAEKVRLEKELNKQERKLFILTQKIEKSTRELHKLNAGWRPSEKGLDAEMITEEERECFRKIGLKLDRTLLLGRRGVFDGVIGGIHQHWKHREIVKVITKQRVISQVTDTARLLEIETGGILISIEKIPKGHAIILYRGKNYRRPLKLIPENLLTKREALHRSLEMQRLGSLKYFASQRQQTVLELKLKLSDLQSSSFKSRTPEFVKEALF